MTIKGSLMQEVARPPPPAPSTRAPAPATTAATPSGRHQTTATAPLFIALPQLPSSSCRQWWKAPFEGDAQLEMAALRIAHDGFGLGFEFRAQPICIKRQPHSSPCLPSLLRWPRSTSSQPIRLPQTLSNFIKASNIHN